MAMNSPVVESSRMEVPGVIVIDVGCRECGYNLRGLTSSAVCPECGTSVNLSLRGDQIRFSSGHWIAILLRGTLLIQFGIISLAGMTFWLAVILNHSIDPSVRDGVLIVIAMIPLWGGWLLTTPDPSGAGEEDYGLARRWVRWMIIPFLGNAVFFAGTKRRAVTSEIHALTLVISTVGSTVSIGTLCLFFHFVRCFSRRLPDEHIERLATWMMITCPIVTLASGALVAIRVYKAVSFIQAAHNRLANLYLQDSYGMVRIGIGIIFLADVAWGIFFCVLVKWMSSWLGELPENRT